MIQVTDVELKYDKATQRMKGVLVIANIPLMHCNVLGFGFVGFDSEEVVEKLAQAHFHTEISE